MATTKTSKKETKVIKTKKARSPLVNAILTTLIRKSWTSRNDLVKAVKKHVTKEAALKACYDRIPVARDEPEPERVRRGNAMQVMLTCITLVQHKKIEQRGRGDTKQYRLAAPPAKS